MKRCALFILLLLVAGAIVNVAVAWGCACYATTIGAQPIDEHEWSVVTHDTWPARASFGWQNDGVALSARVSRAYGPPIPPSQKQRLYGIVRFEAGWPTRAMQWSLSGVADGGTLDYWPEGTDGIWASGFDPFQVRLDEWMFQRRMPLCPIWPGFAINTVFYAFILWLLFAAPFALRRRWRRGRGLCPKCAYPVGTNAVCTECGQPLRTNRAEMQKAAMT